ncbi:MAG TPA: sugar phosphate isomerase/epimerase family protein [Chloroflexota bacterium]|nr:sugar phosphate isomerase/epimerase family protein [Chloroflexota bacterium]
MRIAVSMWSLVTEAKRGGIDAPDFVRYAAGIGAQGAELLDVFWTDQEREFEEVESAVRETGLPVSAYAIGNDLVQTDAVDRADQVQSIRDGIDMARRLGTPRLRIFSGSEKDGVTAEDGVGWIVEGLRSVAPYAEEQGVTLVLENHGLFAGRADQVRRIIESVGSPALRANLDTGNFLLVNQDPVEAVRELAPLAAYVHLKDFRRLPPGAESAEAYTGIDGTRYEGTVIGEGDVDLPGVLSALEAAGYDGWLSIEYEGTGEPRAGLEGSLRNTETLLGAVRG